MKFIKNICIDFLSVLNYPCISKELTENLKGPILLHISDTPVDIYRYIFRIIDILKPQYIIHTGDMADNIKLEIYKSKMDFYQRGVAKLINGLEKNEHSKVYYVLGNHDDYETVSKLTRRGIILQEGILSIDSCSLNVSHYYRDHINNVDFNLYGHSFDPGHHKKDDTVGLNGLLNINIVDLSNKRVFHLDYPAGTNTSRGMELKRIGL
ncbi:MAG: metallophosphoesterase [Sedimentibacter sp.]|uniref:metallophosphoesterase n=1 Tax=Sedimentibacter sp. TaxID=1960295 RepID=UPI0031583128